MRSEWPIIDRHDGSISCWGLCHVWGHDYIRIPESPNGICIVCGNVAQDILSRVHKIVDDRQRQEEWVTRPCAICEIDVDWDRYADAHRTFDGELVCCHQHRLEYEKRWMLSIKPDNGGTKDSLPFKWYWSWIVPVILKRDNHTCQRCGAKESKIIVKQPEWSMQSDQRTNLEVHHIQFRSQGGSNHPANLITLCHECHNNETRDKFERDRIEKKFKNVPKLETYR